MVDILNHIIFDGAPLIIPLMVLLAGVSVYLVARGIDQLLNTIKNLKELTYIRNREIEDNAEKKKNTKRKSTNRKIEKMVKDVSTSKINKKVNQKK